MGSSGGTSDPRFLSQGGNPIPGLPIAGQGAPNDNPRNFGQFQEFLPQISPQGSPGYQIMPAGGGPNPSATGLTADMFQYRSPQGILAPGGSSGSGGGGGGGGADINAMKQQIAALQAQASSSQSPGYGMYGQQSGVPFPSNWTNSNVPNATS